MHLFLLQTSYTYQQIASVHAWHTDYAHHSFDCIFDFLRDPACFVQLKSHIHLCVDFVDILATRPAGAGKAALHIICSTWHPPEVGIVWRLVLLLLPNLPFGPLLTTVAFIATVLCSL